MRVWLAPPDQGKKVQGLAGPNLFSYWEKKRELNFKSEKFSQKPPKKTKLGQFLLQKSSSFPKNPTGVLFFPYPIIADHRSKFFNIHV